MAKKKGKRRRTSRRKTPKRRGGGGGRKKGSRKKSVPRGITGRIGAFVLGVVPPLVSGIEAAGTAMNSKKVHNLSGFGTVQVGLFRWLNNLSNGFLGTIPFGKMTYPQEGGGSVTVETGAGLPKGSLWSVAGVGLLMMVYDAVAAKLAGGRPIKIPFTNFNATGGS